MISFIALCACQVLDIVDFLGSRRMETAPTSIEVLLRPTQSRSDETSDLRGSLSPTTRHRCTMSWCIRHLAVPGGYPSNYEPGATLLTFSDQADTDETPLYSVFCFHSQVCKNDTRADLQSHSRCLLKNSDAMKLRVFQVPTNTRPCSAGVSF